MRPKFFLLASLLLASWPLRLLIYAQSAVLRFPFRKVLGRTPGSGDLNLLAQTPSRQICLLNAFEALGGQTENNEGTVLQNARPKVVVLHRHRRSCALSDTDDELLSIDIRFNPSASLSTSTVEGKL
ncbi:hypothetical protein AAHC03_09210 [Spirometra sp. Aus1]